MKMRVIPGTQLFPWMLQHPAWTVGGALPVRSENETDSVGEDKRLSIRVIACAIWRSGRGEDGRCRHDASKQA